jgi:hypothetical protein
LEAESLGGFACEWHTSRQWVEINIGINAYCPIQSISKKPGMALTRIYLVPKSDGAG